MQSIEAQLRTAAIPAGRITLHGQVHVPPEAHGLVLFAHGSGSSPHSPRNQRVIEGLHQAGFATLMFDLLGPSEKSADAFNASLRFDVPLLASRWRAATRWAREQPELAAFSVGYLGASTGAAAAIVAASEEADIGAVVTRGGRPDLAESALPALRSPTLLIVGGNDEAVLAANLEAWARLRCEKSIETIPGAGFRFEEPGALDNVVALSARWFGTHLRWSQDSVA